MAETSFDLVVIGAGPGGYHAAIRGAQLGLTVAVVEKDDGTGIGGLGGVCLNWGCIPSKSLLKNAEVVNHLSHAESWGIEVGEWSANMSKAVDRSRKVSKALTNGIGFLFKKNKIERFVGTGRIGAAGKVEVMPDKGDAQILDTKAILARHKVRGRENERTLQDLLDGIFAHHWGSHLDQIRELRTSLGM